MCTRKRTGLFLVLLMVLMTAPSLAQKETVRKTTEPNKETVTVDSGVDNRTVRNGQDQPQSRIDAQVLARAEARANSLRDQLVNLQMREIELKSRIDELEYRMRPESIQQALLFVASVRPMDELRSGIRARLEKEKNNASAQLELIAATRSKLEAALRDAEAESDRLRLRLNR